ncbi:MAG TPA: mechanosensitive ion channel family protein [Thermoanaerobaculia bacterium]|jgi:small-conductance mechanosensitive channel/CRP-like cAMP-binding protein|nr:mechanosensitive ion channel family protein [Thermoanaerobaculia bacterium]
MRDALAAAIRRILPAILILAVAAAGVWLLHALHFALKDPVAHRDWGEFAIGVALALVATRVIQVLLFDVGYRLRRGVEPPALLRQLVGVIAFLVILTVLVQVLLSANLGAILATSAILTAVVGLSLQETLGNFFSGLALAMERTVQVGDMVRTGETIALVEQLTWRAIKVRTLEGQAIVIPNSVASKDRLEVYRRSGPPLARIMRVGLEYDAPPAAVREALEAAALDVPGVTAIPPPLVFLTSFDASAVGYELRYWLDDYARFLEIDSRIRERVWYQLQRRGLSIAYPVIRQHQYAAGKLPLPDSSATVAEAVSSNALFEPLSSEERLQLASSARYVRFAEGEIVVGEGDTTSSMFLIVRGRAGVYVHPDSGGSRGVGMLEPGGAFGEISLLTGEPRLATVRAITEVELVEIDKATIAPILEANPSLVDKLEKIIEARRQQTMDRLDESSQVRAVPDSLRSKMARFFGLKGLE